MLLTSETERTALKNDMYGTKSSFTEAQKSFPLQLGLSMKKFLKLTVTIYIALNTMNNFLSFSSTKTCFGYRIA